MIQNQENHEQIYVCGIWFIGFLCGFGCVFHKIKQMSQNQEKCTNPDCQGGTVMITAIWSGVLGSQRCRCETCLGTGIKPNLDESPSNSSTEGRTTMEVSQRGKGAEDRLDASNVATPTEAHSPIHPESVSCQSENQASPVASVSPPPTKPEEGRELKKVYDEAWFDFHRNHTLCTDRETDYAALQAVADRAAKEERERADKSERSLMNALGQLDKANEEITRLKSEIERMDRGHDSSLKERDDAEEALSHAYYLVTGNSPEWSNLFGYAQAHENIADAIDLLKKTVEANALLSEAKHVELTKAMDDADRLAKSLEWTLNEIGIPSYKSDDEEGYEGRKKAEETLAQHQAKYGK